MRKKTEHMNLATEVLNDMKQRLIRYQIMLVVSVICNIILALLYLYR